MRMSSLTITTADGRADAELFRPDGDALTRGVILFPDAGGVRPTMQAMAGRLADSGFVVLLPDTYYRQRPFPPFDVRTVFDDPAERARLGALMRSLDTASFLRDTGAYLATLLADPQVRPGSRAGLVGYCLGGRQAFLAASEHPARVGAVAPIHAGGLVGDGPDSPHLRAPSIRARMYLAVADQDNSCTPEQQATLHAALDAAGVRYEMELYAGARHGFAVADVPAFDARAAETHWQRVVGVLREED